MTGAFRTLGAYCARELRLSLRSGVDAVLASVFVVVAASLFPLGLGPERGLLSATAAGLVWIIVLLAVLLPVERLFARDREDGTLDLVMLAPASLELYALSKAIAHWLLTGVPLVVLGPVVASALYMPASAIQVLVVSLLLGTPILSLIATVTGALTLGARAGGALLALIALPLMVPVLVFAVAPIDLAVEVAGTIDADSSRLIGGFQMLLGAGLALALPLAPIGTAIALRQAVE